MSTTSMSPSKSSGHPPAEDCEYSIPTWKRVPSTWDVFFGLQLPYTAPRNPIAKYVWRKRVWFETTFALSMMASWEKLVLVSVLNTLLVFFLYGAILYFPTHLSIIISRAQYYFSGTDLPSSLSSSSPFVSTSDEGSYVLGVLGECSEVVKGSIQRLISTWRTWNGTWAATGAEL